MPNRKFHNRYTVWRSGGAVREEVADKVNQLVDNQVALALFGPNHRIVGHTARDALLIATLTGTGVEGYLAALLHIEADNLDAETLSKLALILGVSPKD